MAKRLTLILAVVMMVVFAAGTVWGAKQDAKNFISNNIIGNEYPDYLISGASGAFAEPVHSPYDEIMAMTWYDYQHNSRIPRMVANDYQAYPPGPGKHFTVMEMEEPPGNRYVDYNYWDHDGWTSVPPPSDRISEGTGRGGYTGIALMRPLAGYPRAGSRAVVCHHYTEPVHPHDEEYNAVIVIEPAIPGQSAMTGGQYFYDIPEWVSGSDFGGMWPSCGVDSLNRIHVVMDEGNTAAGAGWLGYVRCYEGLGDSIVCESPGQPERRIAKETYYSELDWEVAVFGTTWAISNLVVTSKVSNRVALVWVSGAATMEDSAIGSMQNYNDVFYVESFTGGDDDWFNGTWPEARINITQFQVEDNYRSYGEITGLYDFNDSLHLFFVGQNYNQEENSGEADDVVLFHWSKATERTCPEGLVRLNKVAQIDWDTFPYSGGWNRGMGKVTSAIGIVDSTTDPDHYNKNYLYLQFTRFDDQSDTSVAGNPALWNAAENFVQGEIYATLSTDFGYTWMSPVNLTNSWVDHCVANDCASDHWGTIAERVDTAFYSMWIYDRDAGGYVQEEGVATNNEVLYKAFPTSTIPILEEARLAWSPGQWTKTPINVPVGGTKTVYLTLENIGTDALSITSVTSGAGWLVVGAVPGGISAGGCPAKIGLTANGQGSCAFYATTVNVQSTDQAGNHNINIPVHLVEDDDFSPAEFAVVSNPTFHLGISNTGNLGHQVDTAGMWLYTDLTEDAANFIFDASPAIGFIVPGDATPAGVQNDTLVARYLFDNNYLQSAEPLETNEIVALDTKTGKGEFWPIRIQVPPADQYWPWWKGQLQEHVMSSESGPTGGDKNYEQYLALLVLKLFHDTPPCWWVALSPPASYPTTLVGMALDIDAPSDSGAWNYPGYDEALRMGYLQGYGAGVKENYYFAIAQKDTCYEYEEGYFQCWPNPNILAQPDQPYAMHILRNDAFIYPQSGFRDDSLYKYMNTAGYAVYGDGIEEDYTIATTGAVIGTHSLTDTFEVRYAMVVSDVFGDSALNHRVNMVMCGNVDRDQTVGLADVVYYINWSLKGGPEIWKYMGDVDGDCGAGLSDIVYLISYLFRGGPPPRCSCAQLR